MQVFISNRVKVEKALHPTLFIYLYPVHNQLLNIITKQVSLSESEISLIKEYIEPVLFPKNRIVEAEGKIPQYLYFVASKRSE